MSNMVDEHEGFGGTGFGVGFNKGKSTDKKNESSTKTSTSTIPTTPAPKAPSNPAPTKTSSYGNKTVIPAKKVTDLPIDFLKGIQALTRGLPHELRALGIIGATLTRFEGIAPCPPCHTFHPPKNLDDEDTGDCVYECEEDEECYQGKCIDPDDKPDPDPPDPLCKATMRFGIGGADDRMCRIEAFNVVNANEGTDDGFSWGIEGQPATKYAHIIYDRNVTLPDGLRAVPTQEEDGSGSMTQNYTAGSAQPRPRLFHNHLFKGNAYRIPSVTAESIPVAVMVNGTDSTMKQPTQFNFYRDSADNLYVECPELEKGQSYDGSFLVQLQYKNLHAHDSTNFMNNLMKDKMTFKELAAKSQSNADFIPSMPPLNADAIKSADIILERRGYTVDSPIGEVVKDAVVWLNAFTCPAPKTTGQNLPAEVYLNTESGACRHRAFLAFLIFNRLGLPTRYCTSTCHAWPEFFDCQSRMWVQQDLGGCSPFDPEPCGPCTRPNPLYGIEPDEPECLPVECPEHYYCDPASGKCVPDCDELFPDGDYHYNPRTDRCEECEDGRVWNPIMEMCDCEDCEDGFTLNEDGKCVDDEGNVCETAPLGYYADLGTGMCLPIPDCATQRPGTIFNPISGQCDCPHGPHPHDDEAPPIAYKWDDVKEMCVADVARLCPDGQWWDEAMGRCREIPEQLIPNRPPIPSRFEPEVLEDVIIEDGKVREALAGWLNPKNGSMLDNSEMKRLGEDEDTIKNRGYTQKWTTVNVARSGQHSIAISDTLKGIAKWVKKQDLPDGVVVAHAGWLRSPPVYRLVYVDAKSEGDFDFEDWANGWEKAINKAFPSGRFTTVKSANRLEIRDSSSL